MKKILMIITLLFLSPIVVNAESCSTEQINSYTTYVNQVVLSPKRLGDSNTFEVWASNVRGGIAVEHGRTVFDEGFLGYAQSGEDYFVRVYIADGSACAGQTIKNIKVNIPTPIVTPPDPPVENNKPNESEQKTDPPVVNQKPTTGNGNSTNNDNIQKPSIDESTNNKVENDKSNETIENKEVENKTEQNQTENNKKDKIQNKKNETKSINYVSLSVTMLSFLILIVLLIIYILKRNKKTSKK